MSSAVTSIYLAGPMRHYALANFPAFDAERDMLVAKGYAVVSPADIDRDEGYDPTVDPDMPIPANMTFENCMRRDIEALLHVEAIRFLPGWEFSEGAQIEFTVGKALGLTMWFPEHEVPSRLPVEAVA